MYIQQKDQHIVSLLGIPELLLYGEKNPSIWPTYLVPLGWGKYAIQRLINHDDPVLCLKRDCVTSVCIYTCSKIYRIRYTLTLTFSN